MTQNVNNRFIVSKKKYHCQERNECNLNIKGSRKCPSCRFEKCLSEGMSTKMIGMFSDKPDEKNTSRPKEKKIKETNDKKIKLENSPSQSELNTYQLKVPPAEKDPLPPKIKTIQETVTKPSTNQLPNTPDIIELAPEQHESHKKQEAYSASQINDRKRPHSSSSHDSALSDYSAPIFTREYHKDYFKLSSDQQNTLEKEPGSVESKLALLRYPDINKCLSEIRGFKPKKFLKVDSPKTYDELELLNVEDNDLDPVQILYTGDLHRNIDQNCFSWLNLLWRDFHIPSIAPNRSNILLRSTLTQTTQDSL